MVPSVDAPYSAGPVKACPPGGLDCRMDGGEMRKAFDFVAKPLGIGGACGLAAGWALHGSGAFTTFINMVTSCVWVQGTPPPPCADTARLIPVFAGAGAPFGLAVRLLHFGIRRLTNKP